ncbi:MAG: MFS transporter [Pseudomonadota bacterium]
MKPLHFYFAGTGSWFLAFGIQSVVFAWLVTIVLNESPDKVGFAQMALLLPSMLFMLVGGSLADHYGGRRLAMLGQTAAAFAPLYLTAVVVLGQLTFFKLIVFAVLMGIAQALVTPARDGLLALVADGQIQRRVLQASMTQFGMQMVGFFIASYADTTGAVFILLLQSAVLASGVLAYYRLDVPTLPHWQGSPGLATQLQRSIVEGFRSVRASPLMSAVVAQNCAMGIFFMGSYIVTLPLVVRDVYGGSSQELAWLNIANSLGLVLIILLLLRFGEIARKGRALLAAHLTGSLMLASAGLGLGFVSVVVSIFAWGMCGGVAMTMSRTIMQEQSPPDQRARMMAFFSFSFMGSGPVGALFSGYLCRWIGPSNALIVSSFFMLMVIVTMIIRSSLWQATSPEHTVAR